MDIIKRIQETAEQHPDRIAVRTGTQNITYGQLWSYAGRLAAGLIKRVPADHRPIPVYGHKDPWMIVCFLACVRSGHPYCPIDVSVPAGRVLSILEALPTAPVLAVNAMDSVWRSCQKAFSPTDRNCLDLEQIRALASEDSLSGDVSCPEGNCTAGEDVFYIIFTSGSTGVPKGVQITADCLNHFLSWSVTLGSCPEDKEGAIFLNQAPFSFDLSVMDLYTCLASGGTLVCLEKHVQEDYRSLLTALEESGAEIWVSTPSFADLCLADPAFSEPLLPRLKVFLFCGETLTNRTARRLRKAFPGSRIINTYGPTESTVAVTDVEITGQLAEGTQALPVGRPKPGTQIRIQDAAGMEVPEGEKGEIIILGDTVSVGYYGQPELTKKAFFLEDSGKGQTVRGYHTGDAGWMENGMLHYGGRIDLQIKYHGYRIELEDIESNLCRLPGISQAVVVPNIRGGKVSSLTAFLVSADIQDEKRIRKELEELLPAYMIPKKIRLVDRIPMTANGKADRKALGMMLETKDMSVQTEKQA